MLENKKRILIVDDEEDLTWSGRIGASRSGAFPADDEGDRRWLERAERAQAVEARAARVAAVGRARPGTSPAAAGTTPLPRGS